MRTRVLRGARAALVLATSVLVTSLAAAQQGNVTGKVTDQATGQPLIGARVQATTQQAYGVTNQQGQYTIRGLTATNHVLRIFMLGYGPQSKTVVVSTSGATVDWSLKAVPFQLEEIVTTATGEQATRELGNSVGKIQATQLVETAPVSNLAQVLNGRIAGVTVLQSNGTSGTGARVRIRGLSSASLSNDPLLYIDGIRVAADAPAGVFVGGGTVSKLNDLNPEEIESIEIVKGPSAATLYGTQAANGVIRVTTKRGRAGAPQWQTWAEAGVLKDTYTYPMTYFNSRTSDANKDCLTWQEKSGVCQVAQRYTLNLLNNPQSTPFTTGARSQIGTSVAGGSESMRYFVSAETELEDGVLKLPNTEADYLVVKRGLASAADIPREQTRPNHYNKHNFRINLNASPRSNVDVAISSGFIVNNIRLPQTGDNFESMIGTALFGSANPNVFANTAGYGFSRPGNSIGEVSYRKNDHFINSGTINWRPFSWLAARATTGIDYLNFADEQNVLRGQGCVTCGTENQGKRTFNKFNDAKYTVDLNTTAQYTVTKRIGAKTSLGAQYNHDKLFGVNAQADILPPGIISLSAGAQKSLTEATADVITLGTYVEQQLSLDDRLFITGALRIDDNSAFGKAARSAYYPKVSGSWVAMESRDRGLVNSFRLRAAYGASGQSPRPLDALTYATPVTASIFGQPAIPGVTLGGLGDPNLKPERSREIEAGFEAGFLNNRVNLEFSVYDKKTNDALVQRTQPQSLGGVVSRLENVGVVSNKGIEISINARVIETRNLSWDVQIEAAGNRNRLVSLATGVPPIVGFGFKNTPGYPLFGLWWQGLRSFADKNGDGAIDPTEVVVSDTLMFHGSTVPTRTVALNTSLALFKNKIRIGGQLDYRGGYVTHDVNLLFQCAFQVNCQALHDPSATLSQQAAAVAGPRAFGAYAERADHMRLREASISYTASNTLARAFGAKSMSITLTGRNLWLHKFAGPGCTPSRQSCLNSFGSWDPENVTQSTDGTNYNFVQQMQPVVGILRFNLGF